MDLQLGHPKDKRGKWRPGFSFSFGSLHWSLCNHERRVLGCSQAALSLMEGKQLPGMLMLCSGDVIAIGVMSLHVSFLCLLAHVVSNLSQMLLSRDSLHYLSV